LNSFIFEAAGWHSFYKDGASAVRVFLDLLDQFKNAEAFLLFIRIIRSIVVIFRLVCRDSFSKLVIDNQVFKVKFSKHGYVRADFEISVELPEKALPFLIRYDEWQLAFINIRYILTLRVL